MKIMMAISLVSLILLGGCSVSSSKVDNSDTYFYPSANIIYNTPSNSNKSTITDDEEEKNSSTITDDEEENTTNTIIEDDEE